uniref:F-box domain-containing protein n=1 Tax=Tetradesmus obliquus TaxID=3088 RepID=A0A383WGS2_TETOB|eukprot:jgi/Sobl393_1/16994/SZX76412.1
MENDSDMVASVPLVVLQGIKPLLSLSDIQRARLTCKEWAGELAASVNSVKLPPHLWQLSNPKQQRELRRLVTTYWSFKHAILQAGSEQDVCPEAMQAAVSTLRTIAALRSISISNLGSTNSNSSSSSDAGSVSWAVALEGLSGLPDSVISLDLTNARLPGPEGLSLLLQLPHIQHLTLHSSSSGKLQQQHVAAIAGMQQLKSLKLCFRTVAGALAEPLTLDCLGELGKLTHLEIRYTGMQELATGVCFASEDLPGCKQLVSLVLSRVPTPSLRGLFKLDQLRQVTLLQLAPLDDNQARSLGLCRQLQQLTLDNMPLELLPRLATLTALTALQLSLYSPPAAAAQGLPGGPNLLSLSALVNLQTLSLSGPVLVPAEQVQVFAAAWGRLRKLSLRVTLQGGSRGFAGFKVLEVLRVKPWCGGGSRPVGDAGLGGEEEGPLLSGVGGVTAVEADLPATLRELDGWQLNFAAPAAAAPAAAGESSSLLLPSMPSLEPQDSFTAAAAAATRGLKSLRMHFSPDTPSYDPPQLPSQQLMQGLTSLDMQHPLLTSEQLAAAVAASCSSLKRLSLNAADTVSQFRRPVTVVPCPAAAAGSAGNCSSEGNSSGSSSSSQGNSSRRASNAGAGDNKLMSQGSFSFGGSSSGSGTSRSAFSFLSGAAAAAAAAAAAGPMAVAAGMPMSGMAMATMAATAGIAAAGATAGALSRSNSASFGRMAFGNISNTAGSSGGAAPYATNSSANASSSRGFNLTSMGSIPTLQSMGSASLANMITDALGVGGSGSRGSGTGLSSMGSALNKGSGLAVLGQCSQLEELSIVIGDRGLGPRAREAIAALPQLKQLKVCVAADAPAAAVRDLGGWLAGMRQLQWVGVGLEGPGAADALPGLLDRLTCSLPACQVHMLKGRIGAAA